MPETVRYRYDGETPELFMDNPVHAELSPGDEFDAPAGIVHPRLSVGGEGKWEPTLSDENREPPHDPYDFLRDEPQAPEPAPQAALAPADTATHDSPTVLPTAAPEPPVAFEPGGVIPTSTPTKATLHQGETVIVPPPSDSTGRIG